MFAHIKKVFPQPKPVMEAGEQLPVNLRFYFPDGTPRPLADVQAFYLLQIKGRAYSEIIAKYPLWKQHNITARGVELTYSISNGSTLTPEEALEIEAFSAAWTEIKALRAHSDALEAEMLALTFEELQSWEQHGWPSQSGV